MAPARLVVCDFDRRVDEALPLTDVAGRVVATVVDIEDELDDDNEVVDSVVVGAPLDVEIVIAEQFWQQISHNVMVSIKCPSYPRVPNCGPKSEIVSDCRSLRVFAHDSPAPSTFETTA